MGSGLMNSRLECVPKELLEILREFATKAREVLGDVEIYLFGSYAKCTWLEDIDVDLIVVSDKFEGLDPGKRYALVRKLLPKNKSFDILIFTRREFEEAKKRSIIIQDASEYWIKIA